MLDDKNFYMNFRYKEDNTLEQRRTEYAAITSQFKERVPIILEKHIKSNLNMIEKFKYLIYGNDSLSECLRSFLNRIAENNGNTSKNNIIFLLNGYIKIEGSNESMRNFYNKYKDNEDNILYIAYIDIIEYYEILGKPYNADDIITISKPIKFRYKTKYKPEQRKKEYETLLKLRPNKIPVIIEYHEVEQEEDLLSYKVLISKDNNCKKCIEVMTQICVYYNPDIFDYHLKFYINGTINIPSNSSNILPLYDQYKNSEDNIMYITYSINKKTTKSEISDEYNPFEMEFKYKKENSLESRIKEGKSIKDKFPNKIPIIIERHILSNLEKIAKEKFLVPADLNLNQLKFMMSKRIAELNANFTYEDLVLLINGDNKDKIINIYMTAFDLYDLYRDKGDDMFLYIAYMSANEYREISSKSYQKKHIYNECSLNNENDITELMYDFLPRKNEYKDYNIEKIESKEKNINYSNENSNVSNESVSCNNSNCSVSDDFPDSN